MFAHVIAGNDGTDGGLDAVALARLLGARRLTLVSAYPGNPLPGWDGAAVDDEPVRDAALDDLEEARLAAGIPTELWPAADPSPARALQHVAALTRADLICVGSSRHGALARILLGDVGRSLLDGAPCSVAVAPRGYAELGVAPRHVAVGYHRHPRIRQGPGARRRLGARPRRPPQRRDRLGGPAPHPRARPLAGLRRGLPPGRAVGDGPGARCRAGRD